MYVRSVFPQVYGNNMVGSEQSQVERLHRVHRRMERRIVQERMKDQSEVQCSLEEEERKRQEHEKRRKSIEDKREKRRAEDEERKKAKKEKQELEKGNSLKN